MVYLSVISVFPKIVHVYFSCYCVYFHVNLCVILMLVCAYHVSL